MMSFDLHDQNQELCRICLEVGAQFPIFEKSKGSKDSVYDKLLFCIKEKIEDTLDLPRCICSKCNSTIDMICKFVEQIKDSTKTLQLGLHNIKIEAFSDHEYFDGDVDAEYLEDDKLRAQFYKTANVKTEPNEENSVDKSLSALSKHNELQIKRVKTEPDTSKKKKFRPNQKAKHKTNTIASSILEGNFKWTGKKWCVISSTTIKKLTSKNVKLKEVCLKTEQKKREPAIKIPKIKKNPENSFSSLCDICGLTITGRHSISRHKKTHMEKSIVKCPDCGKMFSEDNLNSHIKRVHGEKTFICAVCGRGFSQANILVKHTQKVHEKHLHPPKRYKCSFCTKTYGNIQSKTIHERSTHTGLRPAVCEVCSASFYHKSYLQQHMMLHTGETPYKCPVCGRGYAQRGNMKSHVHHNHRQSQLTPEQLSKIKPSILKAMKL